MTEDYYERNNSSYSIRIQHNKALSLWFVAANVIFWALGIALLFI